MKYFFQKFNVEICFSALWARQRKHFQSMCHHTCSNAITLYSSGLAVETMQLGVRVPPPPFLPYIVWFVNELLVLVALGCNLLLFLFSIVCIFM